MPSTCSMPTVPRMKKKHIYDRRLCIKVVGSKLKLNGEFQFRAREWKRVRVQELPIVECFHKNGMWFMLRRRFDLFNIV